jgi:hypothetical protein
VDAQEMTLEDVENLEKNMEKLERKKQQIIQTKTDKLKNLVEIQQKLESNLYEVLYRKIQKFFYLNACTSV